MLLFALGVTAALHCAGDDHPIVPPPSADTAFTRIWPVFSHDGRKIFFIGKLFGLPGSGLYEADTSGGAVRLVRWDSLDMADPRLSPDGRRMLYQAAPQYRLACCAHLWVMNVDGTGAQDYTPWGGFWQHHQWSPDGAFIVASGPVEEAGGIYNQILRMNADGTDPRFLTRGDSGSGGPRWDKDGMQIFYVTKHPTNELSTVVYVMNADGSDPRPVDSTRAGGSFPRPSPVRRELALLWQTEASADVGGYIVAYDSLAFPTGKGPFRRISQEFSQRSEWSPDGAQIAQLREGPVGLLTNDLYLVARDGSGERRLTSFYRISFWNWSADGRQIVFSSWSAEPTHEGFFIADVQSARIRKLTIHR